MHFLYKLLNLVFVSVLFDTANNPPKESKPSLPSSLLPTQDVVRVPKPNDNIAEKSQNDSRKITLGVGLGSGLLVLVFLSLLIVFIKRRRDKKKRYIS